MTATVELLGMDQEPAYDALKRRNGADVPLVLALSLIPRDKRAQKKRGGYPIASVFVHMSADRREELRNRRKSRKLN